MGVGSRRFFHLSGVSDLSSTCATKRNAPKQELHLSDDGIYVKDSVNTHTKCHSLALLC